MTALRKSGRRKGSGWDRVGAMKRKRGDEGRTDGERRRNQQPLAASTWWCVGEGGRGGVELRRDARVDLPPRSTRPYGGDWSDVSGHVPDNVAEYFIKATLSDVLNRYSAAGMSQNCDVHFR